MGAKCWPSRRSKVTSNSPFTHPQKKSRRRLALGAVVALAGAGGVALFGRRFMQIFDSTRGDLQQLLGAAGAAWLDDSAQISAWSPPDLNYKPQAYYLMRNMDEAAFRAAAAQVGLEVVPAPPLEQAVWRLPNGVTLLGWRADSLPPGAGLQIGGSVGQAAVSARWHQGLAFLVVTVSGR